MLEVQNVTKSYRSGERRRKRQIVKSVSLKCDKGQSIAIIGESGSGKSTLARMILGIEKPDSGKVLLNGRDVCHRQVRLGKMSVVFQDYKSSLHPYFNVRQILREALRQCESPVNDKEAYMVDLLKSVGLDAQYLDKYPQMMSGGEAQRVAIARAISTKPDYIVLDEAISALDMSIQSQILDLLIHLRDVHQLSFIFITHDIQAAVYLCEDLVIFNDGQIQERLNRDTLNNVQHAYTRELFAKQFMN
ncbi:oligopeptide transporter ATPase subunit [Staphylococcus schleiferi]|uniref:ABC transporter ATP-binding protein n=1 Tax=Staphylococcus coagulans TaxID=74706 RepID=A0A9X0TLS4_9STAP|nr:MULTISPECIES: ABC transporter ATP-binding protein [Staphylococcus]NHA36861.1 ABC transporter ATP-binding protein [Staphylococcus schleiferi]MBA8771942.1 ABC transporter ATP-binding protein [Staphylococcus coagulans]MBA8776333.1 ABC transporter ATP-binding protein [Staphylococcus coagulans]MBA8778621.1 ABC transporter ATP-binding protein [Staphylococcus coagulans]MDR5603415.1 ABC transporter ATP-binding protein [Staphylococcus coagulans]